MAVPVTIGNQTFIKTLDGWVDQKSKAKAPEGLLNLLNNLQEENSPEGKKKRVRIDTSRPVVKLGKTEYVWDLNSGVWIDRKTKNPVNPAFSKLIEAAYQGITQGVTPDDQLYDKSKVANSIVNNMGSAGQTVANKKALTITSGRGTLPAAKVANIKINSPIVSMIEKLATIDGYLKQRLDNQKNISNRNISALREQSIEQNNTQDALPETIDGNKPKKQSKAALIAVAVGLTGLIVAQFEPVQDAISTMVDYTKKAFNYIAGFVDILNDGLKLALGGSAAPPAGTITTENVPNSDQKRPVVAAGYAISRPSTSTGNRYVYKRGETTGYRLQQNEITGNFGIDYSRRANIYNPTNTTQSTPAPEEIPTETSQPDATRVNASPITSGAPAGRTILTNSEGREISSPEETTELNRLFGAQQDAVNGYINPVEGHNINSRYGMRNGDFHTGVDIAAPAGTPIRAVKGGNVTKISTNQPPYTGFGNVVIIDHGDGYQAVYAHLSRFACRAGDRVRQGQIIGYVGRSGRSTGNHLHFIVQKTGIAVPGPGNTVDPAPLLRQGGVTIPAGMEGYNMEDGGHPPISAIADMGLDAMKFIGGFINNVGAAVVGPRTPYPMADQTRDAAAAISRFQIDRSSAIADSRTEQPEAPPMSLPNLNIGSPTLPVQNPPTQSDRNGSLHYLERQGLLM